MSAEDTLPTLIPSRKRNHELWVGTFVIVGVVSVLTALFTLTDASLFRGRYVIQTMVQDAGGIRRGDPVQMRGVNIGRVASFHIAPAGVTVNLEIERQFSISADARIELRSSGLLGGMVANVVPGVVDPGGGLGRHAPGHHGSRDLRSDRRAAGAGGPGAV